MKMKSDDRIIAIEIDDTDFSSPYGQIKINKVADDQSKWTMVSICMTYPEIVHIVAEWCANQFGEKPLSIRKRVIQPGEKW